MKQVPKPAPSIPVRELRFWPNHKWDGPGLSQSKLASDPKVNKFHYLIDHYPSRRQFRIEEVHPGRDSKVFWLPDHWPKSVEYVEG